MTDKQKRIKNLKREIFRNQEKMAGLVRKKLGKEQRLTMTKQYEKVIRKHSLEVLALGGQLDPFAGSKPINKK